MSQGIVLVDNTGRIALANGQAKGAGKRPAATLLQLTPRSRNRSSEIG
jgi:hypothetical protein